MMMLSLMLMLSLATKEQTRNSQHKVVARISMLYIDQVVDRAFMESTALVPVN